MHADDMQESISVAKGLAFKRVDNPNLSIKQISSFHDQVGEREGSAFNRGGMICVLINRNKHGRL